jgi:hypothetical protein
VSHAAGASGQPCDGQWASAFCERVLQRVLGELELAEAPDQAGQHARPFGPADAVDRVGQHLGRVLAAGRRPGSTPAHAIDPARRRQGDTELMPSGRTSTEPPFAAGHCAAQATASSRFGTSIR